MTVASVRSRLARLSGAARRFGAVRAAVVFGPVLLLAFALREDAAGAGIAGDVSLSAAMRARVLDLCRASPGTSAEQLSEIRAAREALRARHPEEVAATDAVFAQLEDAAAAGEVDCALSTAAQGAADVLSGALVDRAARRGSRANTAFALAMLAALYCAVRLYHAVRDQALAQRALALSEARFRRLTEAAFEGVAVSEGGSLVDVNPAFCAMFGCSPSEAVGAPIVAFIAPEARAEVSERVARFDDSTYEVLALRRDGTTFLMEVRARIVLENGRALRVTALRDVTDERRAAAALAQQAQLLERQARELRELAERDRLTGLANRHGFMLGAERMMHDARRTGDALLLVFVDLNGMKPINDAFGHHAGDQALCETAAALRSAFRAGDLIGRLGGDEFVVLVRRGGLDPEALRARVQGEVDARNASTEAPFRLSVSIGISTWSPAGEVPLDTLLAEADAAMYAEKRARGVARAA